MNRINNADIAVNIRMKIRMMTFFFLRARSSWVNATRESSSVLSSSSFISSKGDAGFLPSGAKSITSCAYNDCINTGSHIFLTFQTKADR